MKISFFKELQLHVLLKHLNIKKVFLSIMFQFSSSYGPFKFHACDADQEYLKYRQCESISLG